MWMDCHFHSKYNNSVSPNEKKEKSFKNNFSVLDPDLVGTLIL
jgi:hypothetical protein